MWGGFLRAETFNQINSSSRVSTKGGLIVPGQYFIGNSKETPDYGGGIDYTKRIHSLVFAANLSWDDTYFIDVTGRNDWSSALVYSNCWQLFVRIRLRYQFILNTFELPAWIAFGKLRASWAQVGNDTSSLLYQYSVWA